MHGDSPLANILKEFISFMKVCPQSGEWTVLMFVEQQDRKRVSVSREDEEIQYALDSHHDNTSFLRAPSGCCQSLRTAKWDSRRVKCSFEHVAFTVIA